MTELSCSAPRVVGLGEVLWDLFPTSRQPGGATANVAFHAAQLGACGIVVSRVGRDELGQEIVRYFADHNLITAHIQHDDSAPTGAASIEISDHGHRFTIHEDVAWDRIEFTPHLQSVMQTASAICFGTLAQRGPFSRETIQRCLWEASDECLVVFDINIRQHYFDRATVERSLQSANIVKLNADEVGLVSDLLQMPRESHENFARRLCGQFGVELTCITRAERGCFISSPGETVDVSGIPIQVADTVGAGDAFTAALLMTRLEKWPLEAAAHFANEVGALVASRPGAMPELASEFRQLRKRYSGSPRTTP